MFTLDLDVRGGACKRYVAYFQATNTDSDAFWPTKYYSMEINTVIADQSYSTLLDSHIRYSIETCSIADPEGCIYYTLLSREYEVSENIFEYIASKLVQYGTVMEGTPVRIVFQLDEVKHTHIVMNAGLSRRASREQQSLIAAKSAVDMFDRSNDLSLSITDKVALRYNAMRLAGKYIPKGFGHNPFNEKTQKLLFDKCNEGLNIKRRDSVTI